MIGFIFGVLIILTGIITGVALCSSKTYVETTYKTNQFGANIRDEHGNFIIEEKGGNKHPLRKFSWIPFVGGSLLGFLLIFLGCITSVNTGNTGVITTFGRVEDNTFEAGFHLKAPWNSVTEMDNRVQKSTVQLNCFSSDIQEVTMIYTLNYQIDKSNAQTLYKTVGKDYYATIVEPTISECVKVATAKFTAEQLVQTRSNLAHEIETLLVENLSLYNINVSSTAIEDMDFTDAFTNAVEAKQVAEQKKKQAAIEYAQALEKAENEKEIALRNAEIAKTEAEAAAAQAKIKAEADAEIAKIQAQADMEVAKIGADSAEYQGRKEGSVALQRLASINGWTVISDETTGINELYKADGTKVTDVELEAGAKRLIQYYYTQTWDGVLPSTYVGDDSVDTILIGN